MRARKKRPYTGPDKDGNVALPKKEVLFRMNSLMRMLRDKYHHTSSWIEFQEYMRKEEVCQEEFNRGYLLVFAKYGFKKELAEPDMRTLQELILGVRRVIAERSILVTPTENRLQ